MSGAGHPFAPHSGGDVSAAGHGKENAFLCREMRAADVPACAAIEANAPDGWSADALREELAQPFARLFVAEYLPAACGDGDSAGISAAAGIPRMGAPVSSEPAGAIAALAVFQLVCGEASLYTVSTAPGFRRRGAARALLGHAFARLAEEGARTVFLEVRAQNAPARALYTALGFAVAGTRRGFYQNPGDDAVLMRRDAAAAIFNP